MRPDFYLSKGLDALDQHLKTVGADDAGRSAAWKALTVGIAPDLLPQLHTVIKRTEEREYAIGARALLKVLKLAGKINEEDDGSYAARLNAAEMERLVLRVQVMELRQQLAAAQGQTFTPTPQEKADWDYAVLEIRRQKDAVLTANRREVQSTARAIEAFVTSRGGRVERSTVQAALSAYPHFAVALKHLTLSTRAEVRGGFVVTRRAG